jgi:hypothetical protein
MNIAIVGSRDFNDYNLLKKTLYDYLINKCKNKNYTIVSGGANGADKLGERFADEYGFAKLIFLPDWNKYGKRAGYLRNKQMAEYADALILIWDGKSRGSQMMLELAKQYKLKIYEQVI